MEAIIKSQRDLLINSGNMDALFSHHLSVGFSFLQSVLGEPEQKYIKI